MTATAPEPILIDPLVAQIMTGMLAETEAAVNSHVAFLEHVQRSQRAELELIRERVEHLLSGPYMPTPDSIRSALYPPRAEIEARAQEDPR